MSFVDQEGMINLVEGLLAQSWPKELDIINVPFRRMSYEEAMETYGSDSPDLRIPNKVC